MDELLRNMTAPSLTEPVTATRLTPSLKLIVIHGTWIGIVCLSLFLLIQALPLRFTELQQAGSLKPYQLEAAEIALLNDYRVPLSTYAIYNLIFEIIQISTFVAVGIWLFLRRPNEYGAVLVSLTLILNGIFAPAPLRALVQPGDYPPLLLVMETLQRILTVFFVYTFPNGRFVPSWTKWLALLWSFGILLLPFVAGSPSTWSPLLQGVIVILWLGPSLAAQYYRYRNVSTREQRQQAKWFMFGLGVILAGSLISGILVELIPLLTVPSANRLLFYTLVAVPIFDTALFITLPVAIGIAVARHRLYGLSLVVNRWLVYATITIALLIVFFLAFFLIQGIVQLIGGEPSLALVIATAITVAFFNPARVQIRRFIDHRFFKLRADLNQIAANERAKSAARISSQSVSERTLGNYKLLELIGKGGMGEVYRAKHTTLEQPAAIKILSEMLVDDHNFRVRFEREAKIVAAMNHPNIVKMYDLGVEGGIYYLAMEYIDGEDVGKLLRRHGKLPLEQVQKIVCDVATALDYAHAQGLVHRDVKPGNVMLRRSNNEAVLMDFGIAKLLSGTSQLTTSGLMGTLDYASPEQIVSSNVVDHRADIYALGVMTYQMLTGQLPFTGSVGQIVFSHLQQPAPDLRLISRETPEYLSAAVMRAMAKQPIDRYQTAGEFAKALMD